jgi:prevent-host-death family protein
MEKVGIRELKEKLSHYLRRVKNSGEQIVITDRKKDVALLIPLESVGETNQLLRLTLEGMGIWDGTKPKGLKNPITSSGKSISDMVIEDRR